MYNPLDLTIAIPVKNEEKNLPGCLKSIGGNFAEEVVIIDSGSTDNTCQIAKEYGAQFIEFHWNGKYPKKRNWFLRNYPLSTKWILFLDADEYLTEEFKEELRGKLNGNREVGYWLGYTTYFMGKKLKGGYPLRKLALFKVGAGEYERVDEERWSSLDMEVHEHPVLEGNIGIIRSKIDHRDFQGMSHFIFKHNEYATWEAERFLSASKNKHISKIWTWKQKLKYTLMKSTLVGPIYFLGSFLVLGGWKDGSRGFAFAILKMSYFTQIYCKIREIEQ